MDKSSSSFAAKSPFEKVAKVGIQFFMLQNIMMMRLPLELYSLVYGMHTKSPFVYQINSYKSSFI